LLVSQFKIHGQYFNQRTVLEGLKDYLDGGKRRQLPGFMPPLVELYDPAGKHLADISVREIDLPFLCSPGEEGAVDYLRILLDARGGKPGAEEHLQLLFRGLLERHRRDLESIPLDSQGLIIPCTSREKYSEELISNKGATLLELSRQGYSVPDFVIFSSPVYQLDLEKRRDSIREAARLLEKLTWLEIGSAERPLITALRCAMPCYMPGVMPTFLNVGVTMKSIPALARTYGEEAALRMALNNFTNILLAVDKEDPKHFLAGSSSGGDSPAERVTLLAERIGKLDRRLLDDPYLQISLFMSRTFGYFESNRDLMLTLSKGEEHFPSLILQTMICTVRNRHSQVGVLHSRHPHTGVGKHLESARNIFGEEIMAGTVETEKIDFRDPEEIKPSFPAVYHFASALPRLEAEFGAPITIEYATNQTDRHEFFAVLQLNSSEMTGRAAFISVMDLYRTGTIDRRRVSELIRPFHIKQIESDAIDPESFKVMSLFSHGASVLPRSAVMAQMYFSAEAALKNKKEGRKVCLCKKSFEPSDTIVMGEVDAIVSLTSAAIHVVTICQSYGLPALLNLAAYGVKLLDGDRLVSPSGQEINEGDWITVSSRNRCIYKGQAKFRPARLMRYMNGEPVELQDDEVEAFAQMAKAYRDYHELVMNLKLGHVLNLTEIIRLVILKFRGEEEKASGLVNRWFDRNTDLYVDGVLQSDMGDHLNQHTVFDLLTLDRKIAFFKLALKKCREERRGGYSAGAFMLGRFICLSQPLRFWNSFSAEEIALLVNEWLLFEKYMQILNDVGERKIRQAKRKILEEGLSQLHLSPVRVKTLIPLKLSRVSLEEVKMSVPRWCDGQTIETLKLLLGPYSSFYDFGNLASRGELERICARENIPVPRPDST
jgi:hypothetical protein